MGSKEKKKQKPKTIEQRLREIEIYYKDGTRMPYPDGIYNIYNWLYSAEFPLLEKGLFTKKQLREDYFGEFARQEHCGVPVAELILKLEKVIGGAAIKIAKQYYMLFKGKKI